jgi:hypothetical protein
VPLSGFHKTVNDQTAFFFPRCQCVAFQFRRGQLDPIRTIIQQIDAPAVSQQTGDDFKTGCQRSKNDFISSPYFLFHFQLK